MEQQQQHSLQQQLQQQQLQQQCHLSPPPSLEQLQRNKNNNNNNNELRRAAIALNNTAVSLLVRGFCRDAADTFTDAVRFIVQVHNHVHAPLWQWHEEEEDADMDMEDTGADETGAPVVQHRQHDDGRPAIATTIATADIQTALQGASRRKILSDRMLARYPHQTKETGAALMKKWPHLDVISSHGHGAHDIFHKLTNMTTKEELKVAFLIRIDPIDYDSGELDEDMIRLECSFILTNYGIFHDCLAVTSSTIRHFIMDSPDGHSRSTIQAKAHHLYMWVHALVCATASASASASAQSSSSLSTATTNKKKKKKKPRPTKECCTWINSRFVLLQITLLHSMIASSIKLRLDIEYQKYCNTMASLMHSIESCHSLHPAMSRMLPSAA